MLYSFAVIFLSGYLLGKVLERLGLPSIVGMLIAGIILSAGTSVVSDDFLLAAPDIRQAALIIVLARAGLSLDFSDLRSIGRPAALMCFVPGLFEIAAVSALAPMVLGISYIEAAVLGCILAPVSAAVVVPRMLKLLKHENGKKIPQIIIAGTSADDVLIIVLFLAFTDLYFCNSVDIMSFAKIPLSLVIGAVLGIFVGLFLCFIYKKTNMSNSIGVLIFLSAAFLLSELENIALTIPYSSLLAIMTAGGVVLKRCPNTAERLTEGFSHLWEGAQIMLFALVGFAIQLSHVQNAVPILAILLFGTLFRFLGIFVSLAKTRLNLKEKLFCCISYLPKATVQAAMGAIPLSLGMESGEIILAAAVLSILIFAPVGAFLIDKSQKKLLT